MYTHLTSLCNLLNLTEKKLPNTKLIYKILTECKNQGKHISLCKVPTQKSFKGKKAAAKKIIGIPEITIPKYFWVGQAMSYS